MAWVVDGIDEDASAFGFAHDGSVYCRRRGADDEPGAIEIAWLKGTAHDIDRQVFDRGRYLGRNDHDAGAGIEKPSDLGGRHGAGSDDEHAASDEVEKGGIQGSRHR
jgi:hypothetical protein